MGPPERTGDIPREPEQRILRYHGRRPRSPARHPGWDSGAASRLRIPPAPVLPHDTRPGPAPAPRLRRGDGRDDGREPRGLLPDHRAGGRALTPPRSRLYSLTISIS